jgi:hypothetical protein
MITLQRLSWLKFEFTDLNVGGLFFPYNQQYYSFSVANICLPRQLYYFHLRNPEHVNANASLGQHNE